MRLPVILPLALPVALAACERQPPPPDAAETAASSPPVIAPPVVPMQSPVVAKPPPDVTSMPEQAASGIDRGDPQQVLRAYAAALAARQWDRAARAWGRESGVNAQTLKDAYDRPQAPRLAFGAGRQEGAAGSLYYEAPVTLRFGSDDTPQTGTLVLRRVNDVPGATPEQLRWHIERSTIGANE